METVRPQHRQSPITFAVPFDPEEGSGRDESEIDQFSEVDLSDMRSVGEEMV